MRVLLLALVLCSCGGGSKPEPDEPIPPDQPAEDPEKAAARQRMRERQGAVCEDMCPRLSECAREDALKNDPDAVADKDGVKGEQILAKNTENCVDQCNGPGSGLMTPDQRKRLVECFPIEACGEFVDCTNKALSAP